MDVDSLTEKDKLPSDLHFEIPLARWQDGGGGALLSINEAQGHCQNWLASSTSYKIRDGELLALLSQIYYHVPLGAMKEVTQSS